MKMLSSGLFVATTLILLADYAKPYPQPPPPYIRLYEMIERRSGVSDERCRHCEPNEDCFTEPPGGCMNGHYKDKCGYTNCLKGPGEHCDKIGRNKCAPNLLCKCGVCKGCQKNEKKIYQCFYGNDMMCLEDLDNEEDVLQRK